MIDLKQSLESTIGSSYSSTAMIYGSMDDSNERSNTQQAQIKAEEA